MQLRKSTMTKKAHSLADIAQALGAELRGDGSRLIHGLATLEAASEGTLTFLSNPAYARHLASTGASAVILRGELADQAKTDCLVLENPYLGYATISHWFDPAPVPSAGVHPSAAIAPDVRIPASVYIGPFVVVEEGVVLEENVIIGAGSVVGARCRIGRATQLRPRVTLGHDVSVGERCLLLSGCVVGSDGFGFAPDAKGHWHRIAQIGGVILGDDVEIGANTTVDRGALEPTRIGNGVKIDNLVQIAHNVSIGDHSAMAAQVGIAGSTRIGRHCVFGGASGINGHLAIADGVQLTGMSMVTSNLDEAGVYSSGVPAQPNLQWRKNAARYRQLDRMARRLKELEKKS